MKTNRNLRILVAAAIALAVSACYQITLVQQPHEALTNSTFKGKVVVKRTGASDNGIVAEGVASCPQSVTLSQTINFTRGLTGVAVLAEPITDLVGVQFG